MSHRINDKPWSPRPDCVPGPGKPPSVRPRDIEYHEPLSNMKCGKLEWLEAQVAEMRKALEIYLNSEPLNHEDNPKVRELQLQAVGKARLALASDAGKRHLELDALKDDVVAYAKLEANPETADGPCEWSAMDYLRKALSALDAKDKEAQ